MVWLDGLIVATHGAQLFKATVPASTTLAGFGVLAANPLFHLRVEEACLAATFRERYRCYQQRAGRFPTRIRKARKLPEP